MGERERGVEVLWDGDGVPNIIIVVTTVNVYSCSMPIYKCMRVMSVPVLLINFI